MRQVIVQMEIRSSHYQLHFTIDLSCIENHSVCVRLLSNSKYTDALWATQHRSSRSRWRGKTGRHGSGSWSRDNDQGRREGKIRLENMVFAERANEEITRVKRYISREEIENSILKCLFATISFEKDEIWKFPQTITREYNQADSLRGFEPARIRTCPFGMRAYQHHLHHQYDVSEMHMHVYKYEHLSH